MNSNDDLFEWEGNIRALPPENHPFVYRQSVWYWKQCECGCDLPLVYRDSDDEKDIPMTIRLRGPSSCGFPGIIFLSLIGAPEDEICNAYGDPEALSALYSKYMRENPVQKGILTQEQMADLMEGAMQNATGKLVGLKVIKERRNPIIAHRLEILTPPPANIVRIRGLRVSMN
jgi:hypothetical protein